MKIKDFFIGIIVIIIILTSSGFSQDNWQISLGGAFSKPTGQLTNWFKYGQTIKASMGRWNDKGWFVEGMIEYTQYTKENLSGYPAGKLDLRLDHIALWANGKYPMLDSQTFEPYLSLAGGPVYWYGKRGKIEENEELSIPPISEKILHEWNMGAQAGLGLLIGFNRFKIDLEANYRLIIGTLYPTMQEYIELDGVNGFQSFNINAGIYYSL